MRQQSIFSFSLLLLFLLCTKTLSQSPAAAPAKSPPAKAPPTAPVQSPPAPGAQSPAAQVATTPGPVNVAGILDKAGHFIVFARLMKATQANVELDKQLNLTSNGITIFAPTDNAFSGLKAGTLNSLNDEQKAELVKFHIIPQYIGASQFQTQSNPVRTQAGTGGRVSLNVTMTGNIVNVTTGLTNTTISSTVYNNNQLAIYEVSKVLLPLDLFTPKAPPAPAPAPVAEKPKKAAPTTDQAPDVSTPKINVSGGISLFVDNNVVLFGVGVVAAMLCL